MRLAVLGAIRVDGDGGEPVTVPSVAQRRVLAVLAVHRGAPLAPERLADLVEVSVAALRTSISRIRRVLGDGFVVTTPQGYTLGAVDLDVDHFERLLEHARAARVDDSMVVLDAALELWRGDAYGEFATLPCAIPEAVRLNELVTAAREDRVEALIELGRFAEAVAAAEAHVGAHRLRDRPRGLLMRALAAAGRQSEALRAFRDYRRMLGEEVGVGPGDELVALERRIASGWHDAPRSAMAASVVPTTAPALSRMSDGNIRPGLTSFLGRDREVALVDRALAEHRVVTLIGVGGVGKTRLAIETAVQSSEWPDGVWLVELGRVDDEVGVAAAVAHTLAVRQIPGLSVTESLLRWFGQRRLLLLLDNCEHLLRAAARLASAVVEHTDGITVLATSREPLMVSGEHVVPVPSLALPRGEIVTVGALELFVARARDELPSFDAEEHWPAIEDICLRLDGIPLALELAAAHVRGLSVEDIASRLDERFRLLTGGRRTAVERHATLRAAVAWSYNLLTSNEQHVFDSLSVFTGAFTLDDAITMIDDIDEAESVDHIVHLVDRSMVVRGERSPEYHLLETLRAFGRERLELDGRSDAVRQRHAQLMVAKAAQFRRAAPGPYEHGVVTLYQSQLADYRDAVNWLAEQSQPDAAVRLVEDLFPPLSLRGDNAAPSLWMQELAEVRFETTRASAARRWIAATWCIFHGGDFRRGYELAREAAELDPTSAMAQILYAIAGGFVGKRSDRGLAAAEAALPLARDPAESAFCFLILGNLMLNAGRADEARDVADSFAAWAEEQQYPSAIAYAYQLKAKLICEDEPSDAAELLTRGLDIVRTRTPGAFAAEHNLGRELILVTHRTDRTAAAQVALETLDLSLRHNETGNAVVTFGDTAIVLADAHHDHIAARALGAFRGGAMAPYHAAMLEHTKSTLRERLGAETYERLADQGAQMPPIELTRTVVIALRSLLDA